jgi:hypothetical protein
MRSHRNEVGQILLVLPLDVIGPLRNALQKLAGGVDFCALDAAERNSFDKALRHLWNPGDDQQPCRERTVPIDVLAEAALPRLAAASRAQLRLDDHDHRELLQVREAIERMDRALSDPEHSLPRLPSLEDMRPTVELSPQDLPASPLRESGERTSATHSDGYRAPTKGRHSDVSR